MNKDYYTKPSDEVFENIKEQSIKIWSTYDNTFGYASEKTDYINRLENISDNAMTIVSMFDYHNIGKLLLMVNEEAGQYIKDRLPSSL